MWAPDIAIWLSIGLVLALGLVSATVIIIGTLRGRYPREQTNNATITKNAMLQQAMFHTHHGHGCGIVIPFSCEALLKARMAKKDPFSTLVKKFRKREQMSQAVFARYLNVSKDAVSQWERGEKRPAGSSLKLLSLIERKGLAAIA